MQKNYTALFEAIRATCQQAHWFGPDDLKPEEEFPAYPDDPFLVEYAVEVVAPDDPRRFGFVFPPATEEQVQATETRLGFALPPLLRCLYLQVANGGFGPGLGLPGVKGGYTGGYYQQDDSLWAYKAPPTSFPYTTYLEQAARSIARGYLPHMRVPSGEGLERLLPLGDLGCCQYIGVDSQERMFLTAPTESDAFHSLRQLPWTLEGWLWRWVREESLLEFHQPGAA